MFLARSFVPLRETPQEPACILEAEAFREQNSRSETGKRIEEIRLVCYDHMAVSTQETENARSENREVPEWINGL